MQIKSEIAAAQQIEDEKAAERLADLTTEFSSSKYSKYDYTYEDFKYYFNTKANCKTSRECAFPVVLSKYNCDSVDFEFTFTLKSDEVVSTVRVTEDYVTSLTPINLYIELPNNKSTDYVNLISATCNGESY